MQTATKPRRASISTEQAHALIGSELSKGDKPNAYAWKKSEKPITPGGYSRKDLLDIAFRRKINGVRYFGYGTWEAYVKTKHGVEETAFQGLRNTEKISDDRIHKMIGKLLENGMQPDARIWQDDTTPVTATGQTPSALHALANRHVVDGKSFFGHGTWEKYLEEHHGISFVPYRISPEKLNRVIGQILAAGVSPGATSWINSDTPIKDLGISRSRLYERAKLRKGKNGKSFFGYGNWADYLRAVHKITARRLVRLQDQELHETIENVISRQDTPMQTSRWKESTEKQEEGYSLKSLYRMVRSRRGRNKRLFFGYGSLKGYFKRHHGLTESAFQPAT